MTPEQYAYVAEYVSRSANLLTHVADRGTRYSRDVVREYQRWYNANLSRTQDAFVSLREGTQNLSQLMQDFSTALGELVVDGLWGDRVAFRTALFAVAATPPGIATEVPAWWRVRRAEYATKIDTFLAKSAPPTTEPAPPEAPPATEPPAPAPVTVPDVPLRPGTVVSPDAPPADVVQPPAEEIRITDVRPPAPKTNYFAWLGIAAVLGVGGFLVYSSMKTGRSTGRSPKKARRLQAAAA